MKLKHKIAIATYLAPATGISGGVLMACLHIEKGHSFLGVLHFMFWGIGLYFGAKTRDFLRNTTRHYRATSIKPSWSNALICCLIFTFVLFRISEIPVVQGWLTFVLAINLAYLGAKYKCYVYRCCNVHVKNLRLYPLTHVRLPVLEIFCTLFIIIAAIVAMIHGAGNYKVVPGVLFSVHIILRWYCSLLRFSDRKVYSFAYDYTIVAPVFLFVLFIYC